GRLWHTIHMSWQPPVYWQPVGDTTGYLSGVGAAPGRVVSVAAASAAVGEVSYLLAADDGHVWYTTRHEDGSWDPLFDVKAEIGGPNEKVVSVAATSATTGQVQFMMATESGRLWHSIRHSPTDWQPVGSTSGVLGGPKEPVGLVSAVSVSADEAQFLMIT